MQMHGLEIVKEAEWSDGEQTPSHLAQGTAVGCGKNGYRAQTRDATVIMLKRVPPTLAHVNVCGAKI